MEEPSVHAQSGTVFSSAADGRSRWVGGLVHTRKGGLQSEEAQHVTAEGYDVI